MFELDDHFMCAQQNHNGKPTSKASIQDRFLKEGEQLLQANMVLGI
jgi:hypothetical protein